MRVRYARTWRVSQAVHIDVELLENSGSFHLCVVATAGKVRARHLIEIDENKWSTLAFPSLGEVTVIIDHWKRGRDALTFELTMRVVPPGQPPIVGPRDHILVPASVVAVGPALAAREKVVVGERAVAPHGWR